MDGSCSGIQNLFLAFRDEIGGKAVNLIPMEKPADIYAAVAEKTVKALEEIAAPKPHSAKTEQDGKGVAVTKTHDAKMLQDDEEREKAELRVRAAQWWLGQKRMMRKCPKTTKRLTRSNTALTGGTERDAQIPQTDTRTLGDKAPHQAASCTPTHVWPCHWATMRSPPCKLSTKSHR